MNDLVSVTTPTRLAEDRFQAEVPDGWQQGRGAFGGLVLGNLVRAIQAFDAAPDRPLRSLTAQICGPVLVGPNPIHVERLRTGTGVSTIAARMERDGEVLAHAVGILGRRRGDDTDFCDLAPPVMPPWRELAPAVMRGVPTFASFFEYRVTGAVPFSGDAEPVASGWVRPREAGPVRDAAWLTALIDAWWPAILSRFTAPRPIATLAFTLELFDGVDGLDPEAPLFYRARGAAARAGYLVEMRELWGEDGRLIALNQQTIAIIK
jgi:acyl-CoA thioesterase